MTLENSEFIGGLTYAKEVFGEQIFAAAALRGRSSRVGAGLRQMWACTPVGDVVATIATNAGPIQDELRTTPCPLIQGQVIDSLGFVVNTVQIGVNGRVAIYSNRSFTDFYPFKLLFETGNIETTPALYRSEEVRFVVPRTDLYWFVLNFDGVGTAVLRNASISQTGSILGNIASTLAPVVGFSIGGTFGAFPRVFPSGASITSVAMYNAFMTLGAS